MTLRPVPLLCIALFLIAAAALLRPARGGKPRVAGYDEYFYLAMATSLAFDHDLSLKNDLIAHGWTLANEPQRWYAYDPDTWDQRAKDFPASCCFPIGTALLWQIPIAAGRLLGRIHHPVDPPLYWSLGLFSCLLSAASVLLLARYLCARMGGFDNAWFAATVAFFATPLCYWTFLAPGYSHAASAFAVTLFIVAADRLPADRDRSWLIIGALLGLVYITRWADLLYAVILLPGFSSLRLRALVRASFLFLIGFCLVAQIQWIFWKSEFGQFFITPQGRGFLLWLQPDWSRLLPLHRNSLLSFAPVVPLALAGFCHPSGFRRSWPCLLAMLLALYIALIARDDGGAGMGMRRVTSMYPLVALGLARFWTWPRNAWAPHVTTAILALWGALMALNNSN